MSLKSRLLVLLRIISLLLVMTVSRRAISSEPPVLAIGPHAVLLLDESVIAVSEHVEQVVHQGEKHAAPVLEPTEPWEGDRVYTMGTVLYDPQRQEFRLWYMGRTMAGSRPQDHLLYAVSRDGIHWNKPSLGLHSFQGGDENNIVLVGIHSPSVSFKPDAKGIPSYKLMAMSYKARGYVTATSPDGLQWTMDAAMPAIKGGDNITLTRDPVTQQFMSFHRQQVKVAQHRRRSIFLSVSDDFATWSAPRAILVPDAEDDAAWVTDPQRQRTEFYNMTAAPYQSLYLGFLTVCRFEPTRDRVNGNDQSGTDGPIHVELTYSRDGRSWHRLKERLPILMPGPTEWDRGMILSLSTPIVHQDEVWIYYTGFNTTHGGPRPPKQSAIGRAKWRLDRFVSLRARDGKQGLIETVLLSPNGRRLCVNANAEHGSVTAELLDEQGRTLPGYAREECVPVKADELRGVLCWRDSDQIPTDQPFAIRFYLDNAELFSFTLK